MIFDHPEFDDHEQVAFVRDSASGLRAVIAIHLVRGRTAGGGVRFRPYPTDDAALTDVLRLSAAMTYKMALAGMTVGGAKSVIIGDPRRDKTPELLAAFGRAVDRLGGRYTCGPDVGTDGSDMDQIAQGTSASHCPWIAHSASGLRHATERPIQTRFRSGFPSSG